MRTTKAQRHALTVLFLCGFLVFLGFKFIETFGILIPAGIIAVIFLLIAIAKTAAAARRRSALLAKYQDPAIVEKIINKTVWVGQTVEQLRDTLGPPPDVDQKVLKTKRKEVWKCAHRGGNRYGLRITVENDTVVGWDERL